MPPILKGKCDKCDFELKEGAGAFMVVTDNQGQEKICPHPVESSYIAASLAIDRKDATNYILGEKDKVNSAVWELIVSRISYRFEVVCENCAELFTLNQKELPTEKRRCPACGSTKVSTYSELMEKGGNCPKCKAGKMTVTRIGIS